MNFITGFDARTDVSVVSDLYQAGTTEDGHPYIAEVYFVQVTFPDGRRLRHVMNWAGCRPHYDQESGYTVFEDVRPEATAKAQRLCDRVVTAGRIDEAHWNEVDPAYGSEQYQSQGIEAERAFADRFAA
jgi:hypothetical protein